MKTLKALLISLLVLISGVISAQTNKEIDVTKSTVKWVGKNLSVQHNGTVDIKKGFLVFKKNKLVGGSILVDMTKLTAIDLNGVYLDQLNKHLKSDDFFSTAKYPTAVIIFTDVNLIGNGLYNVNGNLIIKGKMNPITFNVQTNDNNIITSLKVDRTKFDIKYASGSFFEGLGDKVISDDFYLDISIKLI